jgi:hypothetical protein
MSGAVGSSGKGAARRVGVEAPGTCSALAHPAAPATAASTRLKTTPRTVADTMRHKGINPLTKIAGRSRLLQDL